MICLYNHAPTTSSLPHFALVSQPSFRVSNLPFDFPTFSLVYPTFSSHFNPSISFSILPFASTHFLPNSYATLPLASLVSTLSLFRPPRDIWRRKPYLGKDCDLLIKRRRFRSLIEEIYQRPLESNINPRSPLPTDSFPTFHLALLLSLPPFFSLLLSLHPSPSLSLPPCYHHSLLFSVSRLLIVFLSPSLSVFLCVLFSSLPTSPSVCLPAAHCHCASLYDDVAASLASWLSLFFLSRPISFFPCFLPYLLAFLFPSSLPSLLPRFLTYFPSISRSNNIPRSSSLLSCLPSSAISLRCLSSWRTTRTCFEFDAENEGGRGEQEVGKGEEEEKRN